MNARRRSQGGFSLLEVLIALLILSIVVSGVAAAAMTGGGLGKRANDEARANVLMTAFAEAIKALPYQACAPSSVYQAEFDASEAALATGARRLSETENATLEVIDVPPGRECPGVDTGVQPVRLRVTVDGHALERTVVKRTLDAGAEPLDFCIVSPMPDGGECEEPHRYDPELHRNADAANDTLVVWALRAAGNSQIFQYEWWCDGDFAVMDPLPDPLPDPDFVTYDAVGPINVECQYPAPAADTCPSDQPLASLPAECQQRIALRVSEEGTSRTGLKSDAFRLPTTETVHQPPTAQITQVTPASCPSAAPCLPNTEVTFASTGPAPVDASIISWEWDFDDGPGVLCGVSPLDPTGQQCITQSHTFLGEKPGGGPYEVRLRVTDSFGETSPWSQVNVTIGGPQIVRPIVDVNSGLAGSPAYGVAPQPVAFDASGSHADGYPPGVGLEAGIVNYQWDYGVAIDEVPQELRSGPELVAPVFTYHPIVRTTYEIRVTVTDIHGSKNSAVMSVVVDPLVPPINIVNNGDRKGDIPLIRNARFDFQWVNPPALPGDVMETEIAINSAGGFCGFFGGSMAPRVFTVTNNAPGSVQGYRANFSSSPRGFNGVCSSDTFTFTARTKRTTSHGTYYSPWSAPQTLRPEFF